VTGEVHYVDCGFNAVGMPLHENLPEIAVSETD
jgi:enoyl-[acyl-carrier-protein] reductase (NADH)